MISLAISLWAAAAGQDAMPEPYTLYHQALACAVSAGVADAARPDADTPTAEGARQWSETTDEILAWGMVMAHSGPLAGRTPEQVDRIDAERAEAFFAEMREKKPEVFAAHRAYCRSMMPAKGGAPAS
ncbi:hypothetical protein ACO2Q1_14870 [Brevundimonas sp. VNH65]|uniref:hypothetical protein n=1 Tax=Brevundimonas sp. VNH65 TaxID=3400917 RepID=UPI003BFD5E0F